MKKFYVVLAGLIVAASSIFLFNFLGGVSKAALPEDCEKNSIINCGGTTASTLAARYKANKTGDLDNVYGAYGLSAHDMTHAGTVAKMGEVRKDGRVMVGGKTVATNALTIGRYDKPGSHKRVINGKTYYERAPSVGFSVNSIAAYVFFDANGDFRAAVLTSCGNPVTAKKPVYKCENLASKAITRTKYSFTASASASNGATIVSYTFDFGDGKKVTQAGKTVEHEYAKAGTYTAKLSVTVKVHGVNKTVTASDCQKTIKIAELPTYVCNSLTAAKITRTEYNFTGKATVTGGATIVSYTFDFGDGKTQTLTNPNDVKHAYEKAGNYTAKLTVTVKVNGVNKTVTGEKCTVPVKVDEKPVTPTYVCDSLTASKISRTEYNFTGKATVTGGATITNYVFDFGDSKTATVTNPNDVKHEYAQAGNYTAKLTVNVKVGNETKSITGEKCIVPVKVEEKPVTPTYTCDSLTASKITRTEYNFNGKATVTGGATIVSYTFDFGDTKTQTVTNPTDVKHEYAKAGNYTAKLTVTVKVNNENKTVTSTSCTVPIVVEDIPVTPVYTCDSLTATKISTLEASFTGKATATGGATITNYVFDFGDSKTETVTNPTDVKHTYAEAKEYMAKLTVNFLVNDEAKAVTGPSCTVKVTVAPEECKPGIPVGDVRCTEECKPGIPVGDDRCKEECKPGIPTGDERCTPCEVPGKENLPKNSTECVETPVELPHTGMTENLLTLLGAGSLIAAAGYYVASRRALP